MAYQRSTEMTVSVNTETQTDTVCEKIKNIIIITIRHPLQLEFNLNTYYLTTTQAKQKMEDGKKVLGKVLKYSNLKSS